MSLFHPGINLFSAGCSTFQVLSQNVLNRHGLITYFSDGSVLAFQQEFVGGSRMADTQSSQHDLFSTSRHNCVLDGRQLVVSLSTPSRLPGLADGSIKSRRVISMREKGVLHCGFLFRFGLSWTVTQLVSW